MVKDTLGIKGLKIPKGNVFSFGGKSINLLGLPEKNKRKKIREVIRQEVYKKYKGICQICEKKVSRWDFDIGHKRPICKGGSNNINNLFPAHRKCNASQGTKTLAEIRRMLGKKPKKPKETKKPKTQLVTAYDYLGRKVRVPKSQTYVDCDITGRKIRRLK